MTIFFGLMAVLVWLLITFVLPVLAFLRASRAASDSAALRSRVAALEAHLRDLSAASVRPAAATPPVDMADMAADVAVDPAAATPAAPIQDATPPLPLPVDSAPQLEPALSADPASATAAGPVDPGVTGEARAEGDARGLEEAIGGRLLLYVGTIVLVLGAAFFLKYAFDREWITESMRVVLGGLVGMALVVGGLRLGRAGYDAYGQVLTGGGLAVLYLASYAAFGFYGLIGAGVAFALLTMVTAGAALLADRQDSQPMAVMAIGGGFLTPFLVGGTTDAQVTLFSYVTLLLLGTLHLARRRGWPMLNVFGYALTIVTVAAWADAYYAHSKYLRTELFITGFCALFLVALADARRLGTRRGQVVAVILWTAPMLYHAVSLGILAGHGVAFLVYLIAFTVIAVGWAARHAAPEVRVLLWLAALTPLVGWIETHQSRAWIAPSLATLGAVFALHLLAQLDRLSHHPPELRFADVDLLLFHLNGLGLFVGVYVLLERQAITWVPVIGVALVALHAAMAWWLRPRHVQVALHALAVAFALLAATVGVKFDGAWLTAAWAAEGAAVMWIGLRVERNWFRAAGAALMAVAAGRWLALSVL